MALSTVVHAEDVLLHVADLIDEIAPLTVVADVLARSAEFLSRIDGVRSGGSAAIVGGIPKVWLATEGISAVESLDLRMDSSPPLVVAQTGEPLQYRFADAPPAPEGFDQQKWAKANAIRADLGDIDVIVVPLVGTRVGLGSLWLLGASEGGLDPTLAQALDVVGALVAMTLEKIISVDDMWRQLSQIEAMHRRLEGSNRDFQNFAQMASSDLQDPLRKIVTFGERLERTAVGQLSERELDYLTRIHSASDRMQRLLNDLLLFSSVHTTDIDMESVDLELVIADVLSDLEVAISDAKATVKIGELPIVLGNSTQLRQLFQNLIGNAIKFRAPGVAPLIHVQQVNTLGGHVVLEVSDNGIGFDQKFVDRIFRPFQRLHGADSYAGSGIGLSVCRRIAQRHGGELSARAKESQGATFEVSLPAGASA